MNESDRKDAERVVSMIDENPRKALARLTVHEARVVADVIRSHLERPSSAPTNGSASYKEVILRLENDREVTKMALGALEKRMRDDDVHGDLRTYTDILAAISRGPSKEG